MRHDEDEECGVLDNVLQVGSGSQVLWEGNVGEVSRVLVSSVDDIGEFLAVDLIVSTVHVVCS